MRIAEWPERKCRDAIWHGEIAHNCELPDLHPGPHASMSIPSSVKTRDTYEEANPGWRSQMRPTELE